MVSKKRIILFSNSYAPVLGGIQMVTAQISNELIAKKMPVLVVTNKYPINLKFVEKIDNVSIVRLPFGNFFIPEKNMKSILLAFISLILFPLNFLVLLIIFLVFRPTTINIHFPLFSSLYILLLKTVFKFKLITSFHGHDILQWKSELKNKSLFILQKKLLQKSEEITCCSEYLKKEIIRIHRYNKNLQTIYNGININNFNDSAVESKKVHNIIFAYGRLEKHKGFHLLINAFKQLNNPNLKLIIAGEGKFRSYLENLIKTLKMDENIRLVGRKSQEQIVQLMGECDLIVIPSQREPFGIVVIEALSSKKPVIATNVGGIPEIISKCGGFLVEPTVSDLKKGIQLFLNERFNSQFIGKNFEFFSLSKMTNNYIELYD